VRGFELAGFLSEQEPEMAQTLIGRPVLGGYHELLEALHRHEITDVVFAPDDSRGEAVVMQKLLTAKLHGTNVWSALSFTAELTHSLPIELLKPADVVFDAGFTPPAVDDRSQARLRCCTESDRDPPGVTDFARGRDRDSARQPGTGALSAGAGRTARSAVYDLQVSLDARRPSPESRCV
jgi:hypothetical protein